MGFVQVENKIFDLPLTGNEFKLYVLIKAQKEGYFLSGKELAARMNMRLRTIWDLISNLESYKLIKRIKTKGAANSYQALPISSQNDEVCKKRPTPKIKKSKLGCVEKRHRGVSKNDTGGV